jgi:hypothetical protein
VAVAGGINHLHFQSPFPSLGAGFSFVMNPLAPYS